MAIHPEANGSRSIWGQAAGRPGQVIRAHPTTCVRHMDWMTWGLLPHDTADPATAPRPIHDRAETVVEIPIFASAFRRRRAIVPASVCYQQSTIGRVDQCLVIARRDGQPMAIAGLWEAYVALDRSIERTYCSITVEATGAVAKVHDRMPLMLDEADWPLWLGEVEGDPARFLHPGADDKLVVHVAGN
ncbi:SOS response-associated peptidase family protein [Acidisphaera sp. S103]|uniref:SOS response-associated peptidase family protein n=1 Tax=Acidisphaera sp. S103 TaxID=1747223 RepID=UPI00131C7D76|nr:SOS response-associated peptidase family protein [Acidisphaera sp. S103]